VIIAPHHKPGSYNYDPANEPKCAWPDDCYVQWGDTGVVFRRKEHGGSYETAFFEAFPGDTFIRGEGKTVAEAEAHAFAQFIRFSACSGHDFERRNYTNGAGFCKHCGMFKGKAFEPIPEDPNAPKSMLQEFLEAAVKDATA
jgi:hypothetical protein